MRNLGYESHNSMLNLGSIAIFSFVYYLRVLLFFILLKPIVKYTGKYKELQKRIAEDLFYSEIMILSMEAYIEFLISGYLNLQEPITSTFGEAMSVGIGWYSVVITVVVIPVLFVYVLSHPIEKFQEHTFHRKWEGLYEGVNTKRKVNLYFYVWFCMRRILFIALAFYCDRFPIFQVIFT